MQIFGFEDESTRALDYMPLDVRRALDIAGVRLPLRAWQAADVTARQALVSLDVDSDAAVEAFRRAALSMADRAGVTAPTSVPLSAAARVWNSREAGAGVAARARSLGRTWDDARWATLDESARYALYRLSKPEKSEQKFLAALGELAGG